MNPRFLCLSLLACLLLTLVGALSAPVASAIPVFDAANFRQALLDHIKRLFEIAQRAIVIANQIQELDYWFAAMLKLEEIPYREDILELLELQRELLLQFDHAKGQYQAISHSLQEVGHEFDITFPGWRAFSSAAIDRLRIESEAGDYEFGTPLEYARYQSARTLQAVRQTLEAMAHDQASLIESQAHLEHLKETVPLVEGHQQALELQTSFAALSAEQLVALRQGQQNLTLTVASLGAHLLSTDMQLRATRLASVRHLKSALVHQFGALVPEHTGNGGIDPYPTWVNPY